MPIPITREEIPRKLFRRVSRSSPGCSHREPDARCIAQEHAEGPNVDGSGFFSRVTEYDRWNPTEHTGLPVSSGLSSTSLSTHIFPPINATNFFGIARLRSDHWVRPSTA